VGQLILKRTLKVKTNDVGKKFLDEKSRGGGSQGGGKKWFQK